MIKLDKCKWFDNHQTACCLMIDDLAPLVVSKDGKIGPYNDWGYLMDSTESLHNYLDKWLFQKYPEIKGTIFLPLDSHNYIPQNMGYEIATRDIDDKFINFLKSLQVRFEFAFHGIKHLWYDDNYNIIFEYENPGSDAIEDSIRKVELFSNLSGIKFVGGKFPGYKYNDLSLSLIEALGSKWWVLDEKMSNRRHRHNKIRYMHYQDYNYICIPSNITTAIYSQAPSVSFIKNIGRKLKNTFYASPNKYIQYLYNKGYPITIEEHYQNQRADGIRQIINLYDDIKFLDDLFGYLRPLDIWYASCSDIAHYYDTFHRTQITLKDDKMIIDYNGLWNTPLITLKVDKPILMHKENGSYIKGWRKKDYWVYNITESGEYYYSINNIN